MFMALYWLKAGRHASLPRHMVAPPPSVSRAERPAPEGAVGACRAQPVGVDVLPDAAGSVCAIPSTTDCAIEVCGVS